MRNSSVDDQIHNRKCAKCSPSSLSSRSLRPAQALWQAVVQLCNPEAWPLLVGAEFPPLADCRVIYLDRLGVRARYESGGERIW